MSIKRYEARCVRSDAACMNECPWPRCLRVHDGGVHDPETVAQVIRGPWRKPEPRWHFAVTALLALLALAGLGAAWGALLGWLS